MGSVAVGQGQLLDPPPVRRVQVPTGHAAWWGVDPSTLRVSVAGVALDFAGEPRRWARTASFARSEGPARLSEIYRETRRFVESLATCCPWPGVTFVEQPSGKQENPNLSYAVGVIQAAVFDGLREVTGVAPRIETVTSSHWKKVACGSGALYKPKARGGYYGVLDWARQNGYTGSSWDEADALAIAECARREIALEER